MFRSISSSMDRAPMAFSIPAWMAGSEFGM